MVMIPDIQIPKLGDMPKSEPVPEGIYNLRSESNELKVTKSGKNPGSKYVTVTFVVTGPDEKEAFVGRKIFENFMLSGDGLFRLGDFLRATGEDDDYELQDTDELNDRECSAAVLVEPARTEGGRTYEPRNSIRKFLPLGEAADAEA